jgi:DNA-binding NarL/FixJ family response regulator
LGTQAHNNTTNGVSREQTGSSDPETPKAIVSDDDSLPQLAALIDTLELLTEQARAYERALPSDNYPARMAVAALGELARQALAEAQDLRDSVSPPEAAQDHPFSPREHQVLKLAAQGLTNKEIAYRLGVSDRTVQFHMNSVFNKTGASSRTEAATLSLQQGWIRINDAES